MGDANCPALLNTRYKGHMQQLKRNFGCRNQMCPAFFDYNTLCV